MNGSEIMETIFDRLDTAERQDVLDVYEALTGMMIDMDSVDWSE
ncbi:hypothetical protein LCGC14_2256200 [marine sediment metagenome]|uniref:Uncharacterized protein n=1 Tax=marine sediment metagenome TaxID=412755 RepID=A0A0F9D1G9_9ZZZZ